MKEKENKGWFTEVTEKTMPKENCREPGKVWPFIVGEIREYRTDTRDDEDEGHTVKACNFINGTELNWIESGDKEGSKESLEILGTLDRFNWLILTKLHRGAHVGIFVDF